jgi:hypothetical protein
MEYIILFGFGFSISGVVVWRWIKGFDYMDKHHPDYKGNDLFGLDDDDKNQIG